MDKIDNVDMQEIHKFESLAADWWNPDGNFKPLHQLNPLRLDYIERGAHGLFGQRILDVGCGGGILSESMAQLGAEVTGIDMGKKPLEVAQLHAKQNQVKVDYRLSHAESHAEQYQDYYDVVTCMEMLEHVPDPASVIRACHDMVKPGGQVFFSTINRNIKSYIQAILGAEYLLRMLPVGTHEHAKFIKPSELIAMIEETDLIVKDALGITYNPFTGLFKYTSKLDVNYMLMAEKVV